MSGRAEHEIHHGELLASKDTELIWGWGTPAGRVRATRRAKLIGRGAKLGPNVHVLEIGCGTGMFTEMFAQTRARIVAVDISPDLLKKADATCRRTQCASWESGLKTAMWMARLMPLSVHQYCITSNWKRHFKGSMNC